MQTATGAQSGMHSLCAAKVVFLLSNVDAPLSLLIVQESTTMYLLVLSHILMQICTSFHLLPVQHHPDDAWRRTSQGIGHSVRDSASGMQCLDSPCCFGRALFRELFVGIPRSTPPAAQLRGLKYSASLWCNAFLRMKICWLRSALCLAPDFVSTLHVCV